ncbi:hypothetical protein V3C99_006834 [Haemonchus contortus]
MTGKEVDYDEEPPKAPRQSSQPLDRKAKTPRMRAGADNRRFSQIFKVDLPPVIDDRLTEIYHQVTDLSPLPPDFDYRHMFTSYVWRAIFLTSFTLGIRFGNIELISGSFLGLFGSFIVFIVAYILVPVGLLYADHKAEEKGINLDERRITLIGVSALLGVLGSAMNQHYVIPADKRAPAYFLPGLIGLHVQVVGPHFAKDRIKFVAVSVGSAYIVGIVLTSMAGNLSFGQLCGLTVSAILAAINLQIIVAAIINHKVNIMQAHVAAVLMALYQHLIFSRMFGTYKEHEKATPSITGPILFS